MGSLANPVTPIPQFADSDVPLLPTRLRQGDSWNWNCNFPNYPSAQYSLSFILNSQSNRFAFPSGTIEGDEDSQGFDVQLSPTQTAACVPDTYEIAAVLSQSANGNDGEIAQQVTLVLQQVVIDPNLATATGPVDTRSFVKKTLDMIEAAILGDTRPDVQEYEIQGRQLRKYDKLQLEKLRRIYRGQYAAERRANGEYAPSRVIGFRFKPQSM